MNDDINKSSQVKSLKLVFGVPLFCFTGSMQFITTILECFEDLIVMSGLQDFVCPQPLGLGKILSDRDIGSSVTARNSQRTSLIVILSLI